MMDEPSILDYLKSLVTGRKIDLKRYLDLSAGTSSMEAKKSMRTAGIPANTLPILWSILLAFTAQFLLEYARDLKFIALLIYVLTAGMVWRYWPPYVNGNEEASRSRDQDTSFIVQRPVLLVISLPLLVGAFLAFNHNRFNLLNLSLWISGCSAFLFALWNFDKRSSPQPRKADYKFSIMVVLVLLLAFFYRFHQLEAVPSEMFSDHAEKLLDVMDVLDGEYAIYFPRNTGREALQFYITAALIRSFGTGIGFLSLKIGTVSAGFLTLPYIYMLGKELFNKWVGLIAIFFAGIAYWPNVISRIGLRFPFYPLFVAPVLYHLIKGLKGKDYNQLLLAGLFLGFGLHGYSPFRVVPILVVLIFAGYGLKNRSRDTIFFALNGLLLLVTVAFIVFLPLFRYTLENPGVVSYRSLSRLTGIENPIEGSVLIVFLQNLWDALTMFFNDNGVIWVNSVPNRPALDIVSAVFFYIGMVVSIREWFVGKDWKIFAVIFSVPLLMMPSVLSLAYPGENPALNRSSGAIVPVFIIVAVGYYSLFKCILRQTSKSLRAMGVIFIIAMLVFSLAQNYDLVFSQFSTQFSLNAWNSSEMGAVISGFIARGNDPENAFVVPYPHWVDTRLVGINAGVPRKDYAIWPEELSSTKELTGQKLFILKPEDQFSMDALELIYPDARKEIFYSKVPGKNFVIYTILN